MYQEHLQLKISDCAFPYRTLDPENDWVKLAYLVPWDKVEELYAKHFVNGAFGTLCSGCAAHQQRLKYSDKWTVRHIAENPYL